MLKKKEHSKDFAAVIIYALFSLYLRTESNMVLLYKP